MKTKIILSMLLALALTGVAHAAPSLGTWADNVANFTMVTGTTYNFNITVSGVANHSAQNISSCSLEGNSMTQLTAGNGTGVWEANISAINLNAGTNCSKNLTITCTLINTSTITYGNASLSVLPCINTRTNASAIVGVEQAASTFTINFLQSVGVLRSTINGTAVNSTVMLWCNSTFKTGANNVTVLLPEVAINSTYANCPYEAIKWNDTAIRIQVATQLGGAPPNQSVSLTNYLVVMAGTAAGIAGVTYAYIRRKRKSG